MLFYFNPFYTVKCNNCLQAQCLLIQYFKKGNFDHHDVVADFHVKTNKVLV